MSDCANCGHSHTFDGPLKPLKAVDTPCWKCGCNKYAPEELGNPPTTGEPTDERPSSAEQF